jgi:hypothetical protein
MSTLPEEHFSAFCSAVGLLAEPVPPASLQGERRPDFLVAKPGVAKFFVELKSVTPSPKELRQLEILYSGKSGSSFQVEPGAKVRELIAKANPQLKAVADKGLPGILAILCPEPALKHHVDPYAVLTAMRGLDVVPVSVPEDPAEAPTFMDVRSGPKRKMTRDANTTISAILVPYLANELGWAANVFHNRFAARPLAPEALTGPAIHHWRIAADERGWEPHSGAV